MTRKLKSAAALATLLLASWTGAALADSMEADCDVRERGEKKKKQSGSCLFSQRQGFIDIRLNNGKTYSLSPQQNKAGVYKDQDGKNVKRTEAGGNMHKYKWEHRNITVNFKQGSHGGSDHHASGSYEPDSSRQYVQMQNGGAELSDRLTPGSSKRYEFNARSGEDLYVRVAPRSGNLRYQIFNPDNSFLLDSMNPDREYRGELWQSGQHAVEVMNMGQSDATYNIIIGLD